MTTLTLKRPDDWHVHLRDGAALAAVLPFTAAQFGRAIVMPNLSPPITTTELARGYRSRILAALPAGARFEPLMTLYLTPVVYTYMAQFTKRKKLRQEAVLRQPEVAPGFSD